LAAELADQEAFMKTLLLLLAAAGLSGCATYQAPSYDSDMGQAYVQPSAPFIYDRGAYPSGYYPVPYAFPYLFARRPQRFHHGFHHGTLAGHAPHAGHRSQIAGTVGPPHPGKQ
jgi:hypothetical protein